MTLAVNVHAPDLSCKPLGVIATEQPPLSGKALAFARELYRREVTKPAQVRGKVHRHLRLVSAQISATPARGNRVARQAIAAIEEEIARGRKSNWSGTRAQALALLSKHLAASGRLPTLRTWREALHVIAASTGLVVLRGRVVEIRFGMARAGDPGHVRLEVLENAPVGCDTADRATGTDAVDRVSGRDTGSEKGASSGFELGSAYRGTHARVNLAGSSSCGLSFSEWSQACGRYEWTRRVMMLMVRSGDLRGTSRDAARQLLDRAKGKVSTGGRRYALRTASPSAPLWPKHLARQTVLRGLERALVRLAGEGLIRHEGDVWALPSSWVDNAALASRGLEEQAMVVPSHPSRAMVEHLRRNGVEAPETLTAPEAEAISRRVYAEKPSPKPKVHKGLAPQEPAYKPESVPRVDHCNAVHVMFAEASERGLRVGPQRHVDALDAVLREEHAANADPAHEGGSAWRARLDEALARSPDVLAPYLLAVIRGRAEDRKVPSLPAAPMQRVIDREPKPSYKAPEQPPYMAPEHGRTIATAPATIPVFVRTSPLRPWEIAAEQQAAAWGRRKESAA